MMELNDISFGIILSLLNGAFWLFTIFFVVQHYLLRLISNDRLHDFLFYYVPLVRNVFWVIYFIDVVYEFSQLNPLTLCLFGVILALTWRFVKDFIQGTIFRFQKGNLVGQHVKIGEISGQIVRLMNTKVEVELESGEIIQIPYFKVVNEIVAKPTLSKHLQSVVVNLDLETNHGIGEVRREIEQKLYNNPWISPIKSPKIEQMPSEDGKLKLNIVVYTSHEKFITRIKEDIRSIIL